MPQSILLKFHWILVANISSQMLISMYLFVVLSWTGFVMSVYAYKHNWEALLLSSTLLNGSNSMGIVWPLKT